MTLLIVYGLIAIAVSFLCSLLEACLLGIPRSYVESMAEGGAKWGERLREMKDNIDRPLAAILTLNTVAHTGGAAGVGAQVAALAGNDAVGIASAVMTVLILVFSEIIPKTLGAVHARALAPPATATIQALILICLPVVIPLEWVNRLLGQKGDEETVGTAELLAMLRLGQARGVFSRREHAIINNLFHLSSARLSDVLTPRTVVFALPEKTTVTEAVTAHHPLRFSRVPLYGDDEEVLTGYALRSEIYARQFDGRGHTPLADLARPVAVFPELANVSTVLNTCIRERRHMVAVVDEFGGLAGLATLEDLLESLLGEEIVDEDDRVADMQELARRQARRRPRLR